jgi:hypothetical protein
LHEADHCAFSSFAIESNLACVLTDPQKEVVNSWLTKHSGYRLAADSDCDCKEDLQTIRTKGDVGKWKPIPDYHPYVAVGDINGGGEVDFAVAVIRNSSPGSFAILVFGLIKSNDQDPAYFDCNLKMQGIGFFFGPPRPKPYRQVIGPFESEGYLLTPKGQSYRIGAINSEGE